jgi:hypothetical protein
LPSILGKLSVISNKHVCNKFTAKIKTPIRIKGMFRIPHARGPLLTMSEINYSCDTQHFIEAV